MNRLFIVIGVLAFFAGTLFRLAETAGRPVLQMLGFWVLVGAGLWGASRLRRLQADAGRAEAMRAVAAAGPGWRVAEDDAGGALAVGPAGVCAVVFDDTAAYSRGRRAERRLAAARERAANAARTYQAKLANCGEICTVPVHAVLVLLRHAASPAAEPHEGGGVVVLNPEGLGPFLQKLSGCVKLEPAVQDAVWECLRGGR